MTDDTRPGFGVILCLITFLCLAFLCGLACGIGRLLMEAIN